MAKQPKELWPEERKALKAVQMAFDIASEAQRSIKKAAIESDRSPSDQIRSILGLPVKKPVRPRLTLSLSAQELEQLAKKYHMDPNDHLAIKEKAADVLLKWAQKHGDERSTDG